MPSQSSSDYFESNLSSIRELDREAADEIEDAVFDPSKMILETTPNGTYDVSEIGELGESYPVHSRKTASACNAIVQDFQQGMWLAVVFGMGFGYELFPVIEFLKQNQAGAATGLLIIEQRTGLLRAACEHVNLSGLLENKRCIFAFGSRAAEKAKRLIQEHGLGVISSKRIRTHQGCGIDSLVQSGWLEQCRSELIQELQKQQDIFSQKLTKVQERYQTAKPNHLQNVWGHISEEKHAGNITPYLTEAMLGGFQSQGLTPHCFAVKKQYFTQLYRAIDHFHHSKPDLIFSVNASSSRVARFAESYSIPRVVWLVDHPFLQSFAAEYHANDLIFSLCDDFAPPAIRKTKQYQGILHGAVDSNVIKGSPKEEFRASVSYVGSLPEIGIFQSRLSQLHREYIERLADLLIAQKLDVFSWFEQETPPSGYEKILDLYPADAEMSKERMQKWAVLHTAYLTANYRKRTTIAERIIEFDGRIYGSEAWLDYLKSIGKEKHYGGRIVGRQSLADVYASSKINISINSAQPASFINPRVFEVPAMGGFLLSDYCPMMDEVFPDEMKPLWFSDEEQLGNSIQRFLENPEEREQLFNIHREILLKQHTYADRARQILDSLRRENWVE